MKSLMYYVVLIAEASPDLVDILNIFWRGICVESSAPGEFCRPPNPLTLTQATLVVPVLILVLLYVPNMLYVLVLNFCKATKGMRMIDHAILFIFPIFTNMYFNFTSDRLQERRLQKRVRGRSQSSPNISTSASSYRRKRSVFFTLCIKVKCKRTKVSPNEMLVRCASIANMVTAEEGATKLRREPAEKQQPEFSLFHSNIIYALSFTGWMR